MLKIINSDISVLGQSFLDELQDVDWDDDFGRISPSQNNSSRGILSRRPQGIIDENNFEQYEPTNIEDPVKDRFNQELFDEEHLEHLKELPVQNETLGIPTGTNEIEYPSGQQLVYDGIDNDEIISFEYTNRHGQYAGIRTVEPHYTFIAKSTGNEVLVTFDRDQNDIRAFIVNNIHPYGVRYEKVNFLPRGNIMRGIE